MQHALAGPLRPLPALPRFAFQSPSGQRQHSREGSGGSCCAGGIRDPQRCRPLSTAISFLIETGTLLHFPDTSHGLRNLYFLDPVWLSECLQRIFNIKSSKSVAKNGVIRAEDLRMLLVGTGFTQQTEEQYFQFLAKFEIALPVANSRYAGQCPPGRGKGRAVGQAFASSSVARGMPHAPNTGGGSTPSTVGLPLPPCLPWVLAAAVPPLKCSLPPPPALVICTVMAMAGGASLGAAVELESLSLWLGAEWSEAAGKPSLGSLEGSCLSWQDGRPPWAENWSRQRVALEAQVALTVEKTSRRGRAERTAGCGCGWPRGMEVWQAGLGLLSALHPSRVGVHF